MLPIRYTTELTVGSPGLTIPLLAYLRSNALRIELWQRPPTSEALAWKAALMARRQEAREKSQETRGVLERLPALTRTQVVPGRYAGLFESDSQDRKLSRRASYGGSLGGGATTGAVGTAPRRLSVTAVAAAAAAEKAAQLEAEAVAEEESYGYEGEDGSRGGGGKRASLEMGLFMTLDVLEATEPVEGQLEPSLYRPVRITLHPRTAQSEQHIAFAVC